MAETEEVVAAAGLNVPKLRRAVGDRASGAGGRVHLGNRYRELPVFGGRRHRFVLS